MNEADRRASRRPEHVPDEATVTAVIGLFGGAGLLLFVLAAIWVIKTVSSLF